MIVNELYAEMNVASQKSLLLLYTRVGCDSIEFDRVARACLTCLGRVLFRRDPQEEATLNALRLDFAYDDELLYDFQENM